MPDDLEYLLKDLPNLHFRPFWQKSKYDPSYNCLAFAVDKEDEFISSSQVKGYYWPPDTGKQDSLEVWSDFIRQHGYEDCADGEFEPGNQKIVLYANVFGATHAAKQMKNGIWASKLGKAVDIEHRHLDALEGDLYGTPVKFFRIARPDWTGDQHGDSQKEQTESAGPLSHTQRRLSQRARRR